MVETHSPESFRLFIAIAVPDLVKTQIETTQLQLRAALNRAAVRWTKSDQFHLTLRFLGNVESGLVEPLIGALRPICQSAQALELRAAGLGFFPNAKAPRVIWTGIEDAHARLIPFQAAVQQATLKFTSEKAEQGFSGHVTLGRIKQLKGPEADLLARTAKGFSNMSFGEWTAQEVQLMRSELTAGGAQHRLVAAIPLG